ncbi:MAG TPA: hybrid sensor histidine kinase/response regulator [Steroidobacteraceae bacterium]|nr:hybrid sensor histidine kinase/response regulator [Steroidobacteraceae bacterium]
MLDLFRMEVETQGEVLTAGLLALERAPTAADRLEECMRAAHSLKGAARIVGQPAGVSVAHAMEDCFVAAQQGRIVLRHHQIDRLLRGVDLLARVGTASEVTGEVNRFLVELQQAIESPPDTITIAAESVLPPPESAAASDTGERVLRVTAENLNRLLGLTGESLVESRWLKPFADSLLRLKRLQHEASAALTAARESLIGQALSETTDESLAASQKSLLGCEHLLSQRLLQLEMFDGRSTDLANRLYDEALACNMRPFADAVPRFPRMIRDLGRELGRPARLEILGAATQVDRDVLEKLDAPLGHLLRNAVDHGIESPERRRAAGKAAEGVIRLEARHTAGTLQILISDDGAGVDVGALRETIVRRKLATADFARSLSEPELLEFLFLPGFTLKETVTEISGRGVGLDAVLNMVKQLRGTVRVTSQLGSGTRFVLQLPLTLSVVRTLLAEVGGEPYAFPLAYISRTLSLPRGQVEMLEGRQLFEFEGRPVGLVDASQVLGGTPSPASGDSATIIVIGEPANRYGLVVDRFLGERELVVRPLDARLGKVKDIAAAALMEDGSPVLIIDVEDLRQSVEKLISSGRLNKLPQGANAENRAARKRVLVVDDSLTVRELERKLLDSRGYEVEVAVNGMEGWNAVRTGNFDLVVTDIDMPRMDGIELVSLIRKDPSLKSLPVMIVSYKDREEDRRRGLEAGADYYLTKGSFHDDTLVRAVVDLIGEAVS